MTHPFHRRDGDTGRYSGAATIPNTERQPIPAAALVAHFLPVRHLDPMFAQLDTHPEQRSVDRVRLVPVTVVDFYGRAAC